MYSKPAHCYPFNELPVVKSLPRTNIVSTTPTNANFSKISSLLNIERQNTTIKSVNMEKKLQIKQNHTKFAIPSTPQPPETDPSKNYACKKSPSVDRGRSRRPPPHSRDSSSLREVVTREGSPQAVSKQADSSSTWALSLVSLAPSPNHRSLVTVLKNIND